MTTVGQDIMRVSRIISASDDVYRIKMLTAELIEHIRNLKTPDMRLKLIAIERYEEASMWAVKAATAQKEVLPN